MTRKTDIEFSATKGFVKQYPIARLAKTPETGLLLHRFRSMALFCKVKTYSQIEVLDEETGEQLIDEETGKPVFEEKWIIKPILYNQLWKLVTIKTLSMHSAERGVLKDAARTWGTTQSIAAMGSDTRDRGSGLTEDEIIEKEENKTLMKDLEEQIKEKTDEQQGFLKKEQTKTSVDTKSPGTSKDE